MARRASTRKHPAIEKSFKIEGFAALDAILKRITSPSATVEINRNVLRKATEFRDYLRRVAPYDPLQLGSSREYGHLRDNIRTVEFPQSFTNLYSVEVTAGDGFWGYFLEYGTARMEAQPWFRPAWEAFRPAAARDIEKRGENHLKRLVRA